MSEAVDRLHETLRLSSRQDFATAVETISSATETYAFGLGLSGGVAQYLVTRLNRLGCRAHDISGSGFHLADRLLPLSTGSCIVIYAPGRRLAEHDLLLDRAAATGARTVLVTDSLGPQIGDRVNACLAAASSPSGSTSEFLSSLIVTDALLLAVAAHHEESADSTSELLTTMREKLTPESRRRRKHDT
ncbi:MurR/RpiR family transcriptional regulator [Streptomyces sp. NPDC057696]|uniref:MurR/RpiR family transcriptional regulator n=1 Tax=Streptomyces sp. NPDC057696 TaxID=3346218 RepID=UPI0036CD14B0